MSKPWIRSYEHKDRREFACQLEDFIIYTCLYAYAILLVEHGLHI